MKFRRTLTAVLILLIIFAVNVYALDFEASNYYELENIIYEQMGKLNPNFKIKYTGSFENIEKILEETVYGDIYLNSNIKKVNWDVTGTKNVVHINANISYIITPEERAEADKEIERILSSIIKPYMNEHEKVKAVHDYIVVSGKYDINENYFSDYDLLMKGTSVCNGYALLTYNMLQKLNISVLLVSGTGNGEAHIWNMVKLGDYWFHLDTTWNDPVPDNDTVSYAYYMLTDKEIKRDHAIDENSKIPKSSKSYYEYLNELSYNRLLVETGLDMYNEKAAQSEIELKNILDKKILCRPLKISVKIDNSIEKSSINNAMSQLLKNDYISMIEYNQIESDITDECSILNLFIKYKEIPDKIIVELSKYVYNIATDVNYVVYAVYDDKKINITNDVFIYPYDESKLSVSKGLLKFKEAGNFSLLFEFQGLKEEVLITGLNSDAFKYITNKKSDNYVNVKVYDQFIDFSSIKQWPFIENGRTMVPLRAVFEVLNCNVRWEESSRSAVAEYGTTKIIIPADSTTAYINGEAKTLDVPAKIVNDRIMIPLRFVSEAIDKTVVWDDTEKTVLIY